MAYIGNNPDSILQGRNAVYTITATAGQTAFSGTDDNGNTIDLLQAESNNVFLNGSRLVDTTDFTLNGDVLTLTVAAAVNDIMVITTAQEMGHASSYTKAAADSRYINYDGDVVNGTIQMGGGPGNNITFADNNKIVMGTGNDLEIYHSGTNSYIDDVGEGSLFLRSGTTYIQNAAGTKTSILTNAGAGQTLYHNNTPVFETTATGINVTGNVVVSGTVDGVDIAASNTLATAALPKAGGAMTGNVTFADSNEIVMGAGSDLRVYHHPTSGNKIVGSGTYGNIVIQSHQTEIIDNGGIVVADFSADSSSARLHWASSAAGGGGVKLATTSTGVDITNIDLTAIDTDISDTAVDVFIYDTRKDSDGGAWRKRTQHTSWYNETLNTSTRGARKEFPAVAVIVALTNVVKIYDGDDPDMPLWMAITCNTAFPSYGLFGGAVNAIGALNGVLAVGSSNRIHTVNFLSDEIRWASNSTSAISIGIANRQGSANVNQVATGFYLGFIVNALVNDVAMTVLPNAPIDYATGLPVPTIAVATNGGVSVIKDDGSVVDIADDGSIGGVISVAFYGGNKIWTGCNTVGGGTRMSYSYVIPTSDTTASSTTFRIGKYVDPSTSGGDLFYSNVASNISKSMAYGDNNIAAHSDGTGLLQIAENEAAPSTGMTNFISSDYNTGWMTGDIKIATLSDTVSGSATSSVTDRSVNATPLALTGTLTRAAVNTGSELMAYSGFSTSNYIRNNSVTINYGQTICFMGWVKITDVSTYSYLTSIYDTTNTKVLGLAINVSSGIPYLYDNTNSQLTGGPSVSDGQWHFMLGYRNGTDKKLYTDGELVAQATVTAVNHGAVNVHNIGHYTGNGSEVAYPLLGNLALVRHTASIPTDQQIKKIYNDEKHLFQVGAQATLYGTSNAVTSLAYDDDTELLHVGTSAGRSVFQGLRRVDNTTDAVGAAISASNGMVAED